MKTCFKCGATKPYSEFYRHPRMADGHLGKCKECAKRDVAERVGSLSTNIEWVEKEAERCRIKARNKRAVVSKEIRSQVNKRHRDKFPEKNSARAILAYAVKSGAVKRLQCEKCGDPKTHGHHDDYSKPLEVRWLCAKHHAETHVEINRKRRAERVAQRIAQLSAV